MYLQEIFEVVIGLIFVWLVISTATMQIGEWIAGLLKWRARGLEKAIQGMLNDQQLTRLFYDHPLIRSLGEEKPDQHGQPSYIPANKFSTALLNIIQNAETEGSLLLHGLYALFPDIKQIKSKAVRMQAAQDLQRLVELARLTTTSGSGPAMNNLMLTSLQKEISDLGSRYPQLKKPADALLEKVEDKRGQIAALLGTMPAPEAQPGDFNKVLRGMLALSVTNPGLRMTLSSLFIGMDELPAGADCLQTLRTNIESWFNDAMDRLSGRYKRKAQLTAFLIGLALAVVLNVDTINISNDLWREPVVRQAINAGADQILARSGEGNPPAITDLIVSLQDQYLSMSLPLGWSFQANNTIAGETCSFVPGSASSSFGVRWGGGCLRPVGTPVSTNGWLWSLSKLAGLLMTGLATTQGSSFWFDILVKIVNVRATGIKPA